MLRTDSMGVVRFWAIDDVSMAPMDALVNGVVLTVILVRAAAHNGHQCAGTSYDAQIMSALFVRAHINQCLDRVLYPTVRTDLRLCHSVDRLYGTTPVLPKQRLGCLKYATFLFLCQDLLSLGLELRDLVSHG